jgi:hypothetical protein
MPDVVITPVCCPQCGGAARYISEWVASNVELHPAPAYYNYGGDSHMIWDESVPHVVDDEGHAEVQCENGHFWPVTLDRMGRAVLAIDVRNREGRARLLAVKLAAALEAFVNEYEQLGYHFNDRAKHAAMRDAKRLLDEIGSTDGLPIETIDGRRYYRDDRLGEHRAIDNPHDRRPIE